MPHSFKHKLYQVLALIDEHIEMQLNAVIHHEDFQRLEASWRGLLLLVRKTNASLIVKCLNASLKTVSQDLLGAIEVDQSALFKKIYTEEFDHPGGQPYGVLIGDFYFSQQSKADCRDPVFVLQALSQIAAMSFVPLISGFDFQETAEEITDRWQRLRTQESACFIGLALPRVLMRAPYRSFGIASSSISFQEHIEGPQEYVWGNASFIYGASIMDAFREHGWFSALAGCVMHDLPRDFSVVDEQKIMPKIVLEVAITDPQERVFSEQGLLALKDYPLDQTCVFYSTAPLRSGSRLSHVLCVCRFAQMVKVMMRDKIGRFMNVLECETFLQNWLSHYCIDTAGESEAMKAKFPLQSASVHVVAHGAGKYACTLLLKPHDQWDHVQSQLKLTVVSAC